MYSGTVMIYSKGDDYPTAGAALLCISMFVAYRSRFYYAVLFLSLDKWYSNTLLAQLNNRAKRPGWDERAPAFVAFTSGVERRQIFSKEEDAQSSQQAMGETRI